MRDDSLCQSPSGKLGVRDGLLISSFAFSLLVLSGWSVCLATVWCTVFPSSQGYVVPYVEAYLKTKLSIVVLHAYTLIYYVQISRGSQKQRLELMCCQKVKLHL